MIKQIAWHYTSATNLYSSTKYIIGGGNDRLLDDIERGRISRGDALSMYKDAVEKKMVIPEKLGAFKKVLPTPAKPPKAEKPGVGKEPWEMSKGEWGKVEESDRHPESPINPFEYYQSLKKALATEKRRLRTTTQYQGKKRKRDDEKWGDAKHRYSGKESFQKIEGSQNEVSKAQAELDDFMEKTVFTKKELEKTDYYDHDIHEKLVKQALKSGKLTPEDYTRIHAKDYGKLEDFAPEAKQPVEPKKEAPGVGEAFTPAKVISKFHKAFNEKIGGKKADKYFNQAHRLINPNENEVVEYREDGIVTKEGDKYTFHALADLDQKEWRIAFKNDVTDQFIPTKKEITPELTDDGKAMSTAKITYKAVLKAA